MKRSGIQDAGWRGSPDFIRVTTRSFIYQNQRDAVLVGHQGSTGRFVVATSVTSPAAPPATKVATTSLRDKRFFICWTLTPTGRAGWTRCLLLLLGRCCVLVSTPTPSLIS